MLAGDGFFRRGAMPDAAFFGDEGSDTLGTVTAQPGFEAPCLTRLGLYNIPGLKEETAARRTERPLAAYGRMAEASAGKDTMIGHWELAGLITPKPFPTYPEGFPIPLLETFSKETGRRWLCNKPYSGTKALEDYVREAKNNGALIVYLGGQRISNRRP